jgi:hypothetical protein
MVSLKIPKRYSEIVIQRRTDKTMDKRKRSKGQTTIYKTLHRKIMWNNTNFTKNWGELVCSIAYFSK